MQQSSAATRNHYHKNSQVSKPQQSGIQSTSMLMNESSRHSQLLTTGMGMPLAGVKDTNYSSSSKTAAKGKMYLS